MSLKSSFWGELELESIVISSVGLFEVGFGFGLLCAGILFISAMNFDEERSRMLDELVLLPVDDLVDVVAVVVLEATSFVLDDVCLKERESFFFTFFKQKI